TGNTQAVDFNKDGKMDVLIANGAAGGSIRVLLNNCPGTMQSNGVFKCSSPPTFVDGGYLVSNLNAVGTVTDGFGTNVSGGTATFAYGDVDGDGYRDLVVGAPNCCTNANRRLRLFKGCAAGSTGCTTGVENVASQSLSFLGAATDIFISDFSLDGKPDVIVATDNWNYNGGNGGATYYYQNNGTSTPFSAAPTVLTTHTTTNVDYDLGFVFDYDNDPYHSPDMMIADGNDAASYYVIADRQSSFYVSCGDAASGTIDLSSLGTAESVITAARITPTMVLNGGTVTFYMTNESPANWVQASLCAGSTTDYCATFPKATGRSVQWKATMCSNSSHTTTPTITNVSMKFDYTTATEHYKGGLVVNDGVAYVGAFRQPGDRGKFYAVNAGLSSVYWDAGAKLDAAADSARHVYTALSILPTRYDFTAASASSTLFQTLLGATSTTNATAVVNWARSARFGLGTSTVPLTKLGAIEDSTPAILTKPGRPTYYAFATAIDRAHIDSFVASNANRVPLVLVGSKDGMVHAVFTQPTNMSLTSNGTEAWAYIPPTVAAGLLTDYTATNAANAAATDGENHTTVTSYPDGSPTLVDYNAGSGNYKTVAIVAEGNGGHSVTAFDVTKTVDPSTLSVLGPTPMWTVTPGTSTAGKAFTKPAVARVQISGAERYVVVAGTGVDSSDTSKGRVISGYDLVTGALLWNFQMKCALTSDISVFETDDSGEPGSPTLDGYIDRAVFADNCGYVYKINPAQSLSGANMDNTGYGSILANTTTDGKKVYAVFSVASTAGALGSQRPIAGTIGARTDNSTRMVLFFGTGGVESFSSTKSNAFYAVYADTGAIRSTFLGTCNSSGNCEKFYGGTVVSATQVIFTRSIDATVGTGTCDLGSSTVQAIELNADAQQKFVSDFALGVSSALESAIYGDAGALYFATMSGSVARIGTPRSSAAGGDTAKGVTQGQGIGDTGTAGNTTGSTAPFTLMGWRVVL
ncbi:MAG TPA: hypothetical protein VGO00_09940, partial [Kofleriaceae bacterium]|nr:hypothetical protein [Kofleriaceae bacterium]